VRMLSITHGATGTVTNLVALICRRGVLPCVRGRARAALQQLRRGIRPRQHEARPRAWRERGQRRETKGEATAARSTRLYACRRGADAEADAQRRLRARNAPIFEGCTGRVSVPLARRAVADEVAHVRRILAQCRRRGWVRRAHIRRRARESQMCSRVATGTHRAVVL
jgi:hypothetical protein